MAIAVLRNMGGKDAIHPFFDPSKRSTLKVLSNGTEHSPPASYSNNGPVMRDPENNSGEVESKKRTRITHCGSAQNEVQKEIKDCPNQNSRSEFQEDCNDRNAAGFDPDPNLLRRKRIKTSAEPDEFNHDETVGEESPSDLLHEIGTHEEHCTRNTQSEELQVSKMETSLNIPSQSFEAFDKPNFSLDDSVQYGTELEIGANQGPQACGKRKSLRLNAQGKLTTPPKKRLKGDDVIEQSPDSNPTKRGRRKKRKIVILKYGGNDLLRRTRVGHKIQQILDGQSSPPVKSVPAKTEALNPARPTHPFFGGKPSKMANVDAEDTRETLIRDGSKTNNGDTFKTFTTPGKLKFQRIILNSPQKDLDAPARTTHGSRKPQLAGTFEPLWPWKIERDPVFPENLPSKLSTLKLPCARRQKNKTTEIPPSEDLIFQQSRYLPFAIGTPGQGSESKSGIHLPHRSVMAGVNIQDLTENELGITASVRKHQALATAFAKIAHTRSAFDIGNCENIGWCKKYAPICSSEVLQPDNEIGVLKRWLSSLTTSAVVKGVSSMDHSASHTLARKKGRKKKRTEDLDDFIVSSDEECSEMQEITNKDDINPHQETSNSVIRNYEPNDQNSSSNTKNKNLILLSGPHGCGKTAAAYAAANELGFTVFEINPSNRRSGKDILEQVGDMTRNHIVQKKEQVYTWPSESSSDPEAMKDQSTQKTTLKSFFSNTASSKAPKKQPHDRSKSIKERSSEAASEKQKQSLILLEEVDLLYDEDRQFWETVQDIAIRSKRPIILTCNDEQLVPLEELSLHAILRFRAPPVDLATDYLLLIAAAEGHLLNRSTVMSLYLAKSCDLRATMMELSFWCQMAIGDDTGGLSWYLKKWPPGSDLNEEGKPLRVLSRGSFHDNLLFLEAGSDAITNPNFRNEDTSINSWREHDLDPSYVTERILSNSALAIEEDQHDEKSTDKLTFIKSISATFESLSAVDVYARVDLPQKSGPAKETFSPSNHNPLDPSQDMMRKGEQQNFISGYSLLHTDVQQDYDSLDARSSAFVHSRASDDFIETLHTYAEPQSAPISFADSSRNMLRIKHSMAKTSIVSTVDTLQQTLMPHLCIDGTLTKTLATEISPYVRSICAYDAALENQRMMLHSSQEGRQGKHLRTTRASRSALEGSQRSNTRRERWFPDSLQYEAVRQTGGEAWSGLPSLDKLVELEHDRPTSTDSDDELVGSD